MLNEYYIRQTRLFFTSNDKLTNQDQVIISIVIFSTRVVPNLSNFEATRCVIVATRCDRAQPRERGSKILRDWISRETS